MTRHLLRLVWNRKRQNLLLAFEIFLSFLVLFTLVWTGIAFASNWQQPLGFDIDRVWSVRLRYPAGVSGAGAKDDPSAALELTERFRNIFTTLDRLPDIEASAAGFTVPYLRSGWSTGLQLADGRTLLTDAGTATDEFQRVLSIRLLAGRWFTRDDDAAAFTPVVVNERLARELFGDADPVNQTVPLQRVDNTELPAPWRVVGVIEEFRQQGEFKAPGTFVFHRLRIERAATSGPSGPPNVLAIRVTPSTTAAFEEQLLAHLQSIAPDWTFEVRTIADLRAENHQGYVTPLAAVGTVAVFLLMMVALGLTGVVWQSVTARTREFGLRRAKGATIANVRRQVLAELALLTTLAVAAGVALLVQLPLIPLPPPAVEDFPSMESRILLPSIAVSAVVIYLLALLCGWYPSRLATKIQPAEALHYD